MSNSHLAILGGGNMGRALIGGMLRCGTRPEHIYVAEQLAGSRDALRRDFGIQATTDNRAAIESASLVVLAVKPQDAESVLVPLQPLLLRNRPVLLSVAAGIRIAALERWCGAGVPVVRAMPNRPALVGAGATGVFAPGHVASAHRSRVQATMQSVGEVVWVRTEDEIDVVTALSGSGPAYFFLMTELMIQGAIDLGLEPDAARRLAVATLHGSGQLAQTGTDVSRLRAEVTSKGGTTEAALASLESADLRNIVARALEAATRRGREIATNCGAPS